MAPPDRHRRLPLKDSDETEAKPSNTLWVGSISPHTVDSDLMAIFANYGALDCTVMLGTRTYAFVNFRTIDGACAAREALDGSPFQGSSIRLKFALPARPFRHLWIGGFGLSTSKEQLEAAFLKFGKIEECRFFRDRNSAIIEYYKTEDAIAAKKDMNGKRLAGEEIRVDFLRPPPSRRDLIDHREPRDGRLKSMGPPEQWPNRHQQYGGRKDSPPSKVLWIGYPATVRVDEQMLHNAMILFGEIESIRCFPARNYSFVQFRSIDEARRAKEGLQGRLFNDPRITIMFSNSTAPKDNSQSFPGLRGPRPDMFFPDAPFGSFELFGNSHSVAPNKAPGVPPLPGPNISTRQYPSQGFDPHHGGSEFHEFGSDMHSFPDGDFNTPMPQPWGRRSPPAPGILSSGLSRPPFAAMPGGWDGFDMREAKRSRIDGSLANDTLFHTRRGNDETYGDFGFPRPDRAALGQSAHNHTSRGHSQMHASSDNDHYWRGILAKGGTHVCRARCVPLGEGIDAPLPEIINCSARTGLDMLTKHYAEASGFDVVFFLPDSEDDFAAYTEFLRYLGQKNRAGVAKLDDGTTLFLVPPSDFLSKVLSVSGPERLYGVVLKLPQQSSEIQPPEQEVPPPPSHYAGRQQVYDSHRGSNFVPLYVDQTMKGDNSRPLPEDSRLQTGVENPQPAHGVVSHTTQLSSQNYVSEPATTSPVGISLTPELLATLASLIPSTLQTGSTGTNQMPLSSVGTTSSSAYVHDGTVPLQGWRQDHPVTPAVSLEQQGHSLQQLGYQFPNSAPLGSQFPMYTTTPNGPDYSVQSAMGSTQIQDPSLNLPQATAVHSMPTNNYVIPSQGEQFFLPQNNQQYQLEPSFASQNNYGLLQTAEPGVHAPFIQQLNSNTSTAQIGQPQIVMPLPTDQANMGYPSQGQQSQTVLSSFSQGTSEGDADKNQRYQSTLQFAANLLQQLQQQQASGQAAQGGN